MIEIINNNITEEPDKMFRVELIGDPGKAFTQDPQKAIVTIQDDDGKFLLAKYPLCIRLNLFVQQVSSFKRNKKPYKRHTWNL